MDLWRAGVGYPTVGLFVVIALLMAPQAAAMEAPAPRAAPFHGRLSGLAALGPSAGVTALGPSGVTDAAVVTAPDAQNEPTIAVNPTNSRNWVAGANDYRYYNTCGCAWAGAYSSRDGGKGWSGGWLPGYPGGPASVLTGFGVAGDPSVTFGPSGRAYFAGIAFNWAGYGGATDGTIFVARSDDGGTTWLETIVARGKGGLFNDHEQITADRTSSPYRGNVYVSWTQFQGSGATPIVISRSTDGGVTWSAPLTVSGAVTPGGYFQDSSPAVGPDGSVYVAWDETYHTTGAVTSMRIWIARSTDGGATFGAPVVVANPIPEVLHNAAYRHGTYPTLGVAPTGRVFVAWTDNRYGDADILLATSGDGGNTWSSPVRVNDDPQGKGTDQFFPWLAVAPSGRVDLMWYDKRVDPNNYLLDVFVASTLDGKVISANRRATDVSSDPGVWSSFIGDYNGIASTDLQIRPVWTDTRNGHVNPSDYNEDIYTALLSG